MSPRQHITRRALSRGALALGAGILGAACGPLQGGGPAKSAPGAKPVTLRVHVVKKLDVSDWIEAGLQQNIDDWKGKQSNIKVSLEMHGTWTQTYFPEVIALTASDQLGDVVWYPPRHRSHISWGTKFRIVRDLIPIARGARYDLGQFYKGANEHNTWEGKQYWLSYISEPIVPVIVYNKTKSRLLGLAEPKDDWTWEDLANWARRGTTADTFGYHRGNAGGDPFSGGPYLRQWGVEPVDKTGKKSTFMDNREGFIQALTYRYNLMNVWKVSPHPTAGSFNQDEQFSGQRVLAVGIWPFRIQIYPDKFRDFEMDFILNPVVKKGDRRRSMLNEHVFGITSGSKVPEEAFQFLTWISGKEMNVQGLVQAVKGPIARADVWADSRITDRWPTYKKLRPIMENIEPDFVVANFRGEEFDGAMSSVYGRMERGEVPVLETANEIQRLTQVVLDKEAP